MSSNIVYIYFLMKIKAKYGKLALLTSSAIVNHGWLGFGLGNASHPAIASAYLRQMPNFAGSWLVVLHVQRLRDLLAKPQSHLQRCS